MGMYSQLYDDRDPVEWHGGVSEYGFWCIKIEKTAWLKEIIRIQKGLQPILMDGYTRFPHVTVATVGLMNDNKTAIVSRQSDLLKNMNNQAQSLTWQGLSSYMHSPVIKIGQVGEGLSGIRKKLHEVSIGDDDPLNYDPHITLGYYSEKIHIDSALSGFAGGDVGEYPLTQLLFCTYKTASIKRDLSIRHSIDLLSHHSDKA